MDEDFPVFTPISDCPQGEHYRNSDMQITVPLQQKKSAKLETGPFSSTWCSTELTLEN